MEIEYREESRLQVWTIRVNGVFVGLLVLKTDNPWQPMYEVHQWDDARKGFTLYDTITGFIRPDNYQGLRLVVEAMVF